MSTLTTESLDAVDALVITYGIDKVLLVRLFRRAEAAAIARYQREMAGKVRRTLGLDEPEQPA